MNTTQPDPESTAPARDLPGRLANVLSSRTGGVAGALFLGLAALAWYFPLGAKLFPQIEYRQWIQSRPESLGSLLTGMLHPTGDLTRNFSYFFVQAVWQAVQGDIVRANLAQILLLVFSTAGLFLFFWRLNPARREYVPALAASACYGFSLPVLDALTWQATVLDKLAAALTVAGLHVFLSVARLPLGPRRLLLGNFAALGLVFFAYNSKEAAWILVPVGFILVLSPPGSPWTAWWSPRNWANALISLLLPLLYFVYHIGIRLWHSPPKDAATLNHIMGGDLAMNLRHYLLVSFNLSQFSNPPWPAVVILLLVLVLGLALFASWKTNSPALLVPLLGCLGATAIPAKTLYGCPFYLLVPGVFFWWLIHASVLQIAMLWTAGKIRHGFPTVCFVALAAFSWSNLYSGRSTLGNFRDVGVSSGHFRELLPVLAQTHPLGDESELVIAYPRRVYYAYRFLGMPGMRDVAPFVFPHEKDRVALRAWDDRIKDLPYDEGQPLPRVSDRATLIVLDGNLQLIEQRRPGAAPAPGPKQP